MIRDYVRVGSLGEALDILDSVEQVKIVAGGTESFFQISAGSGSYTCLDVTGLQGSDRMESRSGAVCLGNAVKVSQLSEVSSPSDWLGALADASKIFASPQIRNQATVIGNICTGRAVADLAVASMAIGAHIVIAEKGRTSRERLTSEAIRGLSRGKRIATHLEFDGPSGPTGSAYVRLGGRRAFTFSSVAVAVSVEVIDGVFGTVRMVVSPCLPPQVGNLEPCSGCGGNCRICTARRLTESEESLLGKDATMAEIDKSLKYYPWERIQVRDSYLYGSGSYRRNMMRVLVAKASKTALARAIVSGGLLND